MCKDNSHMYGNVCIHGNTYLKIHTPFPPRINEIIPFGDYWNFLKFRWEWYHFTQAITQIRNVPKPSGND